MMSKRTVTEIMATIETVKKYSLQRHNRQVHSETLRWSGEKKKLLIQQAKERLPMRATLTSIMQPDSRLKEATYKLGFTLVKHHKPLCFAEPMVEWAASCDQESKVFRIMPKNRQTITRHV